MLRACMIDGFGWFNEADYRRSWLLFDDVDYVWPAATRGPVAYPSESSFVECKVVRPSVSSDVIRSLLDSARADAVQPTMRDILARVSAKDLAYAQQIVWSDEEVAAIVGNAVLDSDVSLMFLVNKLLLRASETGCVPIVGREYASQIMRAKLEELVTLDSPSRRAHIKGGFQYACIGAGLAFGFVNDPTLVKLPMRKLIAFKEKNARLLDRNQVHLLDIARRYSNLGASEFEDAVARLSAEAEKARIALEDEARASWQSAGFELAKKAALAASGGGLVTAIAVIQHSSWGHVALAAIASGGSVVAASALDVIRGLKTTPPGQMAYLVSAREFLARASE